MTTSPTTCIIRLFSLIALCCLLLPSMSLAQAGALRSEAVANDHSTAYLVADRNTYRPGEPFWIALALDLEGGWHSYWQNPGDSGYPTRIDLSLPDDVQASDIHWPAPQRFSLSGITNYGYGGTAYHFIRITPPGNASGPVTIQADANWLICETICVPESAALQLTIPQAQIPASTDAAFHRQLQRVPEPSDQPVSFRNTDEAVFIRLPQRLEAEQVAFYPVDNNRVSNASKPEAVSNESGGWLRFSPGIKAGEEPWQAVLVPETDKDSAARRITLTHDPDMALPATEQPEGMVTAPTSDTGLAAALLLAVAGGLLLNLMPCVLPVLSLKLLHLVKQSGDSRQVVIRHGLAYTLGVIVSFAVIAGMLILFQQGGAEIGWGFQLQSPVFVGALCLLMLLVGLNLSGVYELPMLLANLGQEASRRESPLGSLATGVLAVVVATPCTAPFMAPAMGYALTQPPLISLSVFVALGAGMAAPFLLITLWPRLIRALPRPGGWMIRFKQCLAFPMYATAAWLLWVLSRQAGTEALALMLAVAVVVAWLVWGMGVTSKRGGRLVLLVVALGVAAFGISALDRLGEPGRLASISRPYSKQQLQSLRDAGRPIFVYATADWCITCKVNERVALNDEQVLRHLETHNIAVLRADWTDYDNAITRLLKRHGRAGVPLYVYYGPDAEGGQVLPQLLTPGMVMRLTGGES